MRAALVTIYLTQVTSTQPINVAIGGVKTQPPRSNYEEKWSHYLTIRHKLLCERFSILVS